MEIPPCDSRRVNEETVTLASVTVLLHPLVILNISEHWTRSKVASQNNHVKVHGVLLGKQNGHHVEVFNSFELLVNEDTNTVDAEFFAIREGQSKQVYEDLDLIGWYGTGGKASTEDELFNRQMQDLNESLLVLKLDPLQRVGEQLPVTIYESVVDNDGKVLFKQVPYTLATDDAERIGVDHVARITVSNTGSNSIAAEHLMGNYQAMQMLSSRLHLLRAYMKDMLDGKLPLNRAHLRDISAILKRLPLIALEGSPTEIRDDSNEVKTMLYRQANDVCFSSLLGSMVQGLHSLHFYLTKANLIIDRRPFKQIGGLMLPTRMVGLHSRRA